MTNTQSDTSIAKTRAYVNFALSVVLSTIAETDPANILSYGKRIDKAKVAEAARETLSDPDSLVCRLMRSLGKSEWWWAHVSPADARRALEKLERHLGRKVREQKKGAA